MNTSKIRAAFKYDPETGTVTRDGKASGTMCWNGYIQLSFKRKFIGAHRVAWLIMTGRWPKEEIDHINGNKADNRWCNLREATRRQNARNQKTRSTSKSGYKGVSFSSRNKAWIASIFDRRHIHIGQFKTAEEASEAYRSVSRKLFGEFSPY